MSMNAINLNHIKMMNNYSVTNKPKSEEHKEETVQEQTTYKQVSADDVFKHMAANSLVVQPKKVINVGKYVDAESAARIAHSMAQFEAKFKANLDSVKGSCGKISEEVAGTIALSMIEKSV